MAPVLSPTLSPAPHSFFICSSALTLNDSRRTLNFRKAFTTSNFPIFNGSSRGRLRLNRDRRPHRPSIRCDAAVAERESIAAPSEKFEYQAEVSRLMDLIVHSLYSHKEVFLRELVSNSSDALDKLRFLSLTEPSLLLGESSELGIKIKPDPENGTVTITDNGIGMTKEELIDCLGTIAQSGTAKFVQALKENKDAGVKSSSLIGQFGVGFYSSFLVSEKVVVSTKSPKSEKQFVWESVADSSSYTIREESDAEKLIPRGTQITLHLRADDRAEFSDHSKIEFLVKSYSQFVSFPIHIWAPKSKIIEPEVNEQPKAGEEPSDPQEMNVTTPKTERYWCWQLANETKPIWMRNPKEIPEEEYVLFYRNTFYNPIEPIAHTHFSIEGDVEFRSILYIPGLAPMSGEDRAPIKAKNIRLYVKRVFISDDFEEELFPRYLCFIKGVVDSDDLPLNVSREILQESRIVKTMRKRLLKKSFDMMQDLTSDAYVYGRFWTNFGKYLKLGCFDDPGSHKRIAPLLRFHSSATGDTLVSLDDYVGRMKEGQNSIYYIAADSLKNARSAPFLERLVQRNVEVLYLIDPIDEPSVEVLKSYKDVKFADVSKGDLDLGFDGGDEIAERETEKRYEKLCSWLKEELAEKVADVQVSKRLRSSPCVLVIGKFGYSANMERLMRSQAMSDNASNQFMKGKRSLEINPDHPIIRDLDDALRSDVPNESAKRVASLLYDTATLASGFTPDSPPEFGNKIYELMGVALKTGWGVEDRSPVHAEDEVVHRHDDDDDDDAGDDDDDDDDDDDGESLPSSSFGAVEPSEVIPESDDPWRNSS